MSVATLLPLPGRRRLDMAWVGAPGTGGLSLPGQEGLTGASVGESVFSRPLLQGHALKKMAEPSEQVPRYSREDNYISHNARDPVGQRPSSYAKLSSCLNVGACTMLYHADTIIFSS